MATNPLLDEALRRSGQPTATPASANVTQGAAFGVFRRPETAGTRSAMLPPIAATGPRTFEPAKSLAAAGMRMDASTDPRSLTYGGSAPTAAGNYAGAGAQPRSLAQAAGVASPPATPAPAAPAPLAPDNSEPPSPNAPLAPAEGSLASRALSGGLISPQNEAAAQSLAQPQGLAAYAQTQGVQAPVVRHSGNDWQSRNELRNLQVSAGSITNRPEWQSGSTTQAWSTRGPTAKGDPKGEVAAYQAALAADLTARGAQPGIDMKTAQENATLQREGMQQAGSNQRSLVQAGIAQQRLAMERETQGYANRASADLERLRGVLADPNATAAQRQQAQQAMAAISGRQTADPYLVVPGGQQIDPSSGRAYNTPSSVFNRQTGQFMQQPEQGGLPQGMTRQVGTSNGKPVYEDASGKRFVAS